MNPLLRLAYEGAARLAGVASAVAPSGEAKLLRALRARRGLTARFAEFGRSGRDETRPLLWMHAPSIGEGLQARPVLELVRQARSDIQIAYTFFSPSAERFARTVGADFADYLPFDSVSSAHMALDALRPRALVFSKLDVWPTLAREANRRGVRLGLISATLAERSGRRAGLAAPILRDAYRRLDVVGAIDPADAERLVELGVRRDALSVTGDTRYDQVWARAAAVDQAETLLGLLRSDRPTLVAGSTWPADERVLLPAWTSLRARLPAARLIIAPHEPTEAHVATIEQWAAKRAISSARLGDPEAGTRDVVIVDRVGVLGDLYALADAAFVGGGFHSAGLHSVLEPAAFGAPVLFGPRHANSRDASLLLVAEAAAAPANAADLLAILERWLSDEGERVSAGQRARTVVERGLGAAERSRELVERLL